MLQLALHPEVVRKGQEELDRVIGIGRTPNWDDEANLPYIRSIIKEIMRYRPITKAGMIHMVTEDDEYKGYFIPKDAIIMISWWAIHFDPKRYPDPYQFKPERFLNHKLSAADYAAHPDVSQRDHFGYGAGRRICGMLLIILIRSRYAYRGTRAIHCSVSFTVGIRCEEKSWTRWKGDYPGSK
jgi:cytochrome P450